LGRLLWLLFSFVVDFDLQQPLNRLTADGAPGGLVPQDLGTLAAHALQRKIYMSEITTDVNTESD
jgi:hypothetical protein